MKLENRCIQLPKNNNFNHQISELSYIVTYNGSCSTHRCHYLLWWWCNLFTCKTLDITFSSISTMGSFLSMFGNTNYHVLAILLHRFLLSLVLWNQYFRVAVLIDCIFSSIPSNDHWNIIETVCFDEYTPNYQSWFQIQLLLLSPAISVKSVLPISPR